MLSQPKIVLRGEQPYAAVRLQVAIPFGDVIPSSFDGVTAWLSGKGLAPSGAPFIRYLTTDMSRKLDIEIGWPTASLVTGDRRITTGTIPAGRYAVALYTGAYDGLVDATAAFLKWAEENQVTWKKSTVDGVEWWDARLEHYLTDPAEEPDPQKWQTELAFLVAD
jgi:effector-binding domain-containing protein